MLPLRLDSDVVAVRVLAPAFREVFETRHASSLRMTPISGRLLSHAHKKTWHVHYCAADRAAPDFLRAVVGGDAHDVEAAVKRLQFGPRVNPHSNAARRAVFDVNRNADRDLS